MASKRTPGSRPGLYRCNRCGEEYSVTYRRCPFCDEFDEYGSNEAGATSARSSGKRLARSNRRGGGYGRVSPFKIIGYLISLAVIVAAIYVVITVIYPLITTGDVGTINPDTPPSGNVDIPQDHTPDRPPVTSPDITEDPDVTGDTDTSPSPTVSAAPGTANGFTLNKSEFSITKKYPNPVTLKVTFTPAGTSGTVTWTSSNTNYVIVDQNGKVSAGPQKGTAIITATLDNGVTQTCKVHNEIGSTGSSSNTGQDTPAASGSYRLNKTDFTFERDGETTRLKVKDSNGNDYTGTISWSSTNASIASISSDGVCTAVGNGTCTIIATLEDGTQLEAIARVRNQS